MFAAAMAECGVADSPASSPADGKKKAQQSPVCSSSRSRYPVGSPGHCFRRVTLTKPTFCHNCSDFIWGLVGFLCEGMAVLHISVLLLSSS